MILHRMLLALLAGLSAASSAIAEDSERIDGHEVHFNALVTTSLDAAMARQYGIERSARRGMVVLAVQAAAADGEARGVPAQVSGEAVNLTGRRVPIAFREIAGSDVSYIGLFDLDGVDTWTFHLSIQPQGAQRAYPVRFNRNLVGG